MAHDRLLNLASKLSSADSVQDILEQAIDAAMDVCGADCGWVCLQEEDTGSWKPVCRRGLCREYPEYLFDDSVDLLRTDLLVNPDRLQPFDTSKSLVFNDMMRQAGATTWRVIPLKRGRLAVGCMVVSSRSDQNGRWSAGKALEIIGVQTGCALARVRAEDELRAHEQAQRSAIATQTELACRHLPDGTLASVNDAYCRFFGMSSEDLVGTSFFHGLDAWGRDLVERRLARLVPGSPENVLEVQVVAASGELRWLRWNQRAIFDKTGMLIEVESTGRDITEKVTILKALEESEQRYRILVETARDVISTLDMEFRFTYVSPSVTTVLGYQPLELASISVLDTLAEDSRKHMLRAHEELLTAENTIPGRPFSITEQIEQYHKDGHPVWVETTMTLLRDRDGKPNGIMMISRDVTDRRLIEQMKSDFVTTAAHHLRTPLTPILGFSELLLVAGNLTLDERARYLGYIRKNAETMADIISDLLDISRIESGEGMPLRPQMLDLHETIEEIVEFYRESSSIHQIETTLPADSIEAFADKYKITKLFRNLLDNAIKYSPAGGLIKLICESFAEHYLFAVADNGVGMSPVQVKRVFDPFYRVDRSDTAVPGTGLGLTVARNIVEGQGGRMWVESERNRGTTVWFTLPMRPPKYCE